MDFSKKLCIDDKSQVCMDTDANVLEKTHISQKLENKDKNVDLEKEALDDINLMETSEYNELSKDDDVNSANNAASLSAIELINARTSEAGSSLEIENIPIRETATPMLSSRFSPQDSHMSPPARPLTCSEVGNLNLLLEPDDEFLPVQKSRSMPVSPVNTSASTAGSGPATILLPHMNALFDYNLGDIQSTARLIEARRKRLRDAQTLNSSGERSPSNLSSQAQQQQQTQEQQQQNQQQQFCLRWNNYQTNLTNVFDELLQSESFVDVTLACEGQSIKAHKVVLSACSPYFQALFFDNPCQHPIIIMRDVRWPELKSIMEFMYKGEINVSQEQIDPLLKVAEMLKIRGLAQVSAKQGERDVSMSAAPHFTLYDDDMEDHEVAEHVLRMVDPTLDDSDEFEAKRVRLNNNQSQDLQLNLSGFQQRKRSRDGLLIGDQAQAESRQQNRSPTTPTNSEKRRETTDESAGDNSKTPFISVTTSTIVRNPFASPNATPSVPQPATSNNNSSANNQNTAADNSSAVYRQSPAPVRSPSTGRNSEDVGNSSNNSNANSGVSSNHSYEFGSAASAMPPHQLPSHSHSVGGFSSSQLLPTHHHHHNHHHGAPPSLHATHSHAAIASALAAAAAGASNSANVGSGPPTGPSPLGVPSSHHDDLEIKPEIAEMIREEERVSAVQFLCIKKKFCSLK